MGGGCGPNCTTFTLNVPLSTLSDGELESIRESIIALLKELDAGKVTVSFREGSTKAYASTKNPVNEETLNGIVTDAGAIQTLGDSNFIIAKINGTSMEYNNKLIIVKTNNDIEYIDDVGEADEVGRNDWISKGITGDQIKHVAFGKNVKTIGVRAFFQCDSLTEVTIPNSVTTIEERAFYRCTSLTEVTLPDSVETIGDRAFRFCNSVTEFSVDAGNTNYSSDDNGVLFNKKQTDLIQYPAGNTRNTYTIPDLVTIIGDYAFYRCPSLTEVTIPNSVETIGDDAFYECTSLTEVTIGNSVTTIGDSAFSSCDSLTEVTIPNSVETIGPYAFFSCTSLKEVTIPNSVETIGISAFYDCTSVTEVTIPNSVETIGISAFADCTSLTEFSVDTGNTNYSSDDKGVLFNKTKTDLIQYPVGNTRNTYTISDLVETIGPSAFAICTSLTEINVAAGNTNYSSDDGVLFNNDITELIQYPVGNTRNTYDIPDTVETIGDRGFEICTSLTEVTIPNSVETIGAGAFGRCTSLTEVTIPNSVKTIGGIGGIAFVFAGCIALALVKWDTTNVTTIRAGTFIDCPAVSDPTNFRVNNAMPPAFGFNSQNGDFSDLSVDGEGLEFGAVDSGGPGFKTVKVV